MDLFQKLDTMKASAKVTHQGRNPFSPDQLDKFLSSVPPAIDNPQGNYRYCHGLHADTSEIAKLIQGVTSGSKLYPPGGFLDWHTNSDRSGIRVYFVYVEADGGWFRYARDGKIITLEDKPGWNIRAFPIDRKALLWHCVFTTVERYSFGFNCQTLLPELEKYII